MMCNYPLPSPPPTPPHTFTLNIIFTFGVLRTSCLHTAESLHCFLGWGRWVAGMGLILLGTVGNGDNIVRPRAALYSAMRVDAQRVCHIL